MKRFSYSRRAGGRWWLGVFMAWGLGGCAELSDAQRSPNIVLPVHIQKVGLRTFQNRTQYFGLEDRLRLRVEQEMIRDGRLPFAGSERDADGLVQGEIVNYIPQVATYDANNQPLEYRLWVIMNVSFIDLRENRILWEEPRLEQSYRYFIDTQAGGMTEEDAREQVWDLFARDIVKRVVEGFGSVSGASEKKVPDAPLPISTGLPASGTTPAPESAPTPTPTRDSLDPVERQPPPPSPYP